MIAGLNVTAVSYNDSGQPYTAAALSGRGDSFVFEGEQGTLYQIDVTIDGRPLSCCVVTLYDADGEELDRGEDSEAVRIFWEAESTGRYHVIVENDRLVGDSDYTPTFTLTLATR